MGCPHLQDLLNGAVASCPFLHELATRHGDSYAQQIAVQPSKPARHGAAPVLEEGLDGFQATYALFHGSSGVVPLARPCQSTLRATEAAGRTYRKQERV